MKLFILCMGVGLGGGIGATARHACAWLLHGIIGLPEYASIMIVNISGCFLIGLVFFLLESMFNRTQQSKLKKWKACEPLIADGLWPESDPTQPVVRDFKEELQAQLLAGFLITGILGGMTTFSLFSLLSLNLQQNDQHWTAMFNTAGSVLLGLIATYLGLHTGRLLTIRRRNADQ